MCLHKKAWKDASSICGIFPEFYHENHPNSDHYHNGHLQIPETELVFTKAIFAKSIKVNLLQSALSATQFYF